MKRTLEWVTERMGAPSEREFVSKATDITGWSIDTRTLAPGDLFFAIRGPNHDGHAHAAQAVERGAVGVVADRSIDVSGPVFHVPDVLQAMQSLASDARREWNGEVIGITGSAGKTTTKDIVAALLADSIPTTKTEGNFNNHIGLPLSLLRIPETAQSAVLEMGMNKAGEIRELAEISGPQIGVVTNVGWAHIEAFESIEGIAAAKQELIDSLGPKGCAVLNADDSRVSRFAEKHPGKTLRYGFASAADVRATDVQYERDRTTFRCGTTSFETALTGRHNVSNILAGIAVAGLHGIPPESLVDAVRHLHSGKMRGERIESRGILIYNDCYNSNPDAAKAMLDVLRDTPARRRFAVLGEMLELGHWAELLHRDVGDYAARGGVDVLVGIRGAASFMLDAAKRAGLRADAAFFFEDPDDAGRLVRTLAQEGDAVLFKGSRGVRVERALQQFVGAVN